MGYSVLNSKTIISSLNLNNIRLTLKEWTSIFKTEEQESKHLHTFRKLFSHSYLLFARKFSMRATWCNTCEWHLFCQFFFDNRNPRIQRDVGDASH